MRESTTRAAAAAAATTATATGIARGTKRDYEGSMRDL